MYEAGVNDYGLLRKLEYPGFHDPITQGYWIFDGTTFWTFDDPESISAKTDYVRSMDLGGVMFWELAGDTRDGELIKAIYEGLFEAP